MIGALECRKPAPLPDLIFKRGISVEDARPFCNTFKGIRSLIDYWNSDKDLPFPASWSTSAS